LEIILSIAHWAAKKGVKYFAVIIALEELV